MKLRGITFAPIFFAPGTFGYFGEEKSLCLNLFSKHIVFISKKVTAFPSNENSHKQQIVRKLGGGVVLIKEGVPSLDLESVIRAGRLQKRNNPFFVSIAFVGEKYEKRIIEARKFVEVLINKKSEFQANFGLFLCFSDSIDGEYDSAKKEIGEIVDIFSVLEMPLVVEVSVSFPPDMTRSIFEHVACDAIALRGSVAWNDIQADAKKVFFQTEISPLAKHDNGIVFGKYIGPLSYEWARQAKKFIVGKKLIVGGGILNSSNIQHLADVGVSGIVLDRSIFLRFWNIRKIIQCAKQVFREK